jgi:hypothetical protein
VRPHLTICCVATSRQQQPVALAHASNAIDPWHATARNHTLYLTTPTLLRAAEAASLQINTLALAICQGYCCSAQAGACAESCTCAHVHTVHTVTVLRARLSNALRTRCASCLDWLPLCGTWRLRPCLHLQWAMQCQQQPISMAMHGAGAL